MLSKRGVSTVLGLVLLIGMVATISVGILLVAGDVMTSVEQQSENERVEQSFVEMSQQMVIASSNNDTTRSMEFDAGERGAVVMTDTGTINISSEGLEDPIEIPIGAVEYVGDDGTRIAYQAGGVFRETGNETRVVSAPPVSYDSDDNTFSFPITEVNDDSQLNSGDIRMSHANTEAYRNATYVEQSTVTIEITSEYCVGWETYFDGQTQNAEGQAIRERCGSDDTLVVELGRTEVEGDFSQAVYAGGGGIELGHKNAEIDGNVTTDGEIHGKGTVTGESTTNADTSIPSFDSVIESKVEDAERGEGERIALGDNKTTLEGGNTYYDPHGFDLQNDVTVDLEDGNVTLVVDGDMDFTNNDLTVDAAAADENASFQVFTTGNMSMDNQEVCVNACDYAAGDAKDLQIYGTSSMLVHVGTGNSKFEGILYAPRDEGYAEAEGIDHCSHEVNGTEPDVCIEGGGGAAQMYGTIMSGPMYVDNNFDVKHDTELTGFDPDVRHGVLPPRLTYLSIGVHELDIENE
ncbi:DUF7289 family protein [Natrinema longum]|uniref:DUF7289 family protein n=1 Tax=Natrinema longum TaxID=370324 RepID=UPI001CCB10F0|nr:hypothetical protein [Natrinema longum]